jgi:hypothetical protein
MERASRVLKALPGQRPMDAMRIFLHTFHDLKTGFASALQSAWLLPPRMFAALAKLFVSPTTQVTKLYYNVKFYFAL